MWIKAVIGDDTEFINLDHIQTVKEQKETGMAVLVYPDASTKVTNITFVNFERVITPVLKSTDFAGAVL